MVSKVRIIWKQDRDELKILSKSLGAELLEKEWEHVIVAMRPRDQSHITFFEFYRWCVSMRAHVSVGYVGTSQSCMVSQVECSGGRRSRRSEETRRGQDAAVAVCRPSGHCSHKGQRQRIVLTGACTINRQLITMHD